MRSYRPSGACLSKRLTKLRKAAWKRDCVPSEHQRKKKKEEEGINSKKKKKKVAKTYEKKRKTSIELSSTQLIKERIFKKRMTT